MYIYIIYIIYIYIYIYYIHIYILREGGRESNMIEVKTKK